MTSTEVDTMDAGSLRAAYVMLMNEHQALLSLQDKLAAFALELIRGANDGASFDGWEIQDAGRRHGLITHHEPVKRCGEHCECAQYGFPTECFRIDEALAKHGKAGK